MSALVRVRFAAAAIGLVAALVATGPRRIADACSCVTTSPDPRPVLTQEQAAAYGPGYVVFTGTAISHRMVLPTATPNAAELVAVNSADPVEWSFAVDQVLHGQGSVGAVQTIQTPGDSAACGAHFEAGDRYQVVATRSARAAGALEVQMCSATIRLGAPAPPAAAATVPTAVATTVASATRVADPTLAVGTGSARLPAVSVAALWVLTPAVMLALAGCVWRLRRHLTAPRSAAPR